MKMLLLAMLLFAQRPASTALQTGTVTGRLLNEDGSPAVKVRVSAMSIPDNRTGGNEAPTLMTLTETDSAGRYRLTDVPVGRYYIVAGFVDSPTYYPRGTGPSGATPVNVTFNATAAGIDFRIERPSSGLTVSGRVIHESNPSFGTVQVHLSGGASGSFTNLSAVAKLDGSFEFVRVRPGTYNVTVNPSPFQEARVITVSDKDVTGLEVRIPWVGDVTGRVAVDGGGPTPSFQIVFVGGGRTVNSYAQGAGQGFRATLPEGYFASTVSGIPSGFYLKSVTSGETDLLSNPLRMGRAGLPSEILVTLGISTPAPWVKLNGRVTSAKPGTATTISINGPIGSLSTAIAADGSFEFPKVLPGSYTASFSPAVAIPGLPGQPVTLVVPNKDVTGLELALPAVKEISGRIVVEGGGPIPRPTFMVTPTGDDPKGTSLPTSAPSLAQLLVTSPIGRGGQTNLYPTLQENGTFKISFPEGRYPVTVQLPITGGTSPYSLKSFTYGSTDLTKDPLSVSTADSDELILTFSPSPSTGWSKVTGRVVGVATAGTAAPNSITVSLTSPAFATPLTATIGADGSFEFPRVYSGNYQARLNGFASNAGAPAVEVNVGNSDVRNVELIVPRQKEISGRLVLEGQGALPRLNIPIVSSTGAMTGRSTLVSINPKPDGTFRIAVPEGEHQVGRPSNLPAGYSLKSVHYGSTDLAGISLKVTATDTAELRIVVATPNLPSVRVRGNVKGLDPAMFSRAPITVNLTEPRLITPLQATVLPDGSFEFPAVFPGNYTARLAAALPNVNTTTTVNVTGSDVTNLELVVPRMKDIVGRMVMEGPGPMPRVVLPMSPIVPLPSGAPASPVSMNILPQADGTFRVSVPEGERRAGVVNGLPQGYRVRSMTYGTVDLLTSPMKVAASDTAELRIIVSTQSASPVKVSGKVTGLDAATFSRGSIRVIMNAAPYAGTLQALVSPDGSFEFPEVFPANWSARVTGPGIVPSATLSIAVANTEVRNVEIALPGQKEITGRVMLEGSGPMPRFSFSPVQSPATGTSLASQTISINPAPNGTFRLTLPEGERPLGELTGVPAGYTLKAAAYGTTDLLRQSLRIARTDTGELVLTLSAPTLKPVTVSGKVDGLEAPILAQGIARVVLTSPVYAGGLNTPVKLDGSFEFPSVYPGNYVALVNSPTLINGTTLGVAPQAALSPIAGIGIPGVGAAGIPVVVTDSSITGLNLSMARQHTINGRVEVQGGGPLPRFQLTFPTPTTSPGLGTTTVLVLSPQPNGTFRFALPEGERSVGVGQLPPGYAVKSITYGTVDLREAPIKIEASQPTSELRVILEKIFDAPMVRVSGKVTGLPAEAQNVRVGLVGAFNAPQEVPLTPDGTFTFLQVFQGPGTVRLLGNIGRTLPAPVPFTAGATDVTNLEIAVQR